MPGAPRQRCPPHSPQVQPPALNGSATAAGRRPDAGKLLLRKPVRVATPRCCQERKLSNQALLPLPVLPLRPQVHVRLLVRPCAQARSGRCPPGPGVTSDLLFVCLFVCFFFQSVFFRTACLIPVPTCRRCPVASRARPRHIARLSELPPAKAEELCRTEGADGEAAPPRMDRANIMAAIDGSLRRLQTDRIDLYQLHWPARYVPLFGMTQFNPENVRPAADFEEQVQVRKQSPAGGTCSRTGSCRELPSRTACLLATCCMPGAVNETMMLPSTECRVDGSCWHAFMGGGGSWSIRRRSC